jgi:hypothetical protein
MCFQNFDTLRITSPAVGFNASPGSITAANRSLENKKEDIRETITARYLKKGVGDHRLTRRAGLYEACKGGPTLVRGKGELCGKGELHGEGELHCEREVHGG